MGFLLLVLLACVAPSEAAITCVKVRGFATELFVAIDYC